MAKNSPAKVEKNNGLEKFFGDIETTSVEGTPEEIALRIVEDIFQAETVEDVLSGGALMAWENYLDTPFRIQDVHFNKSDYEVGTPVYAIVSANDQEGEQVMLSSGSLNVVSQLRRIQQLNGFPVWVMCVGNETRQGYVVYRLITAKPEA